MTQPHQFLVVGRRDEHRQTYEWFAASPLADAPDELADPGWGAGYDFAAEARALELL